MNPNVRTTLQNLRNLRQDIVNVRYKMACQAGVHYNLANRNFQLRTQIAALNYALKVMQEAS